ncbi:MAG TPA: phosphatase PAP2 family protein [Steroidobacteraceae bacterium]|jgi:undecaprenyl-diphosphatase|nr:phosphatase PAP2 family protein [Steroidobacteraceae bacterium]
MIRHRCSIRVAAAFLLLPAFAQAGGGPLGIDSELPLDTNGIWARKYQTGLENGVIAVEVAGALWFGNDDRLGHVFWQDIDATALSGAAAEILKYGFSRSRPYQGDNPNAWFKGHGNQSFPSGEVTLQAAFVTPLIANYYKDTPAIWALTALPVYDAVARLKSQAHWQSDVIAGGLLGAGFGYWMTRFNTPLSVQILPGGLTVGFSKRF